MIQRRKKHNAAKRIHNDGPWKADVILMLDNIKYTLCHYADHVYRQRQQHHEEKAIITSPNTVV